MHGRGVQRDLRDRFGGEVGKLELLNGAVPVDGQPDRVTGATALGQRNVHHPRPAEFLEQILGHLECASIGGNVLAENQGFRSLREDLVMRPVQRLRQGQSL